MPQADTRDTVLLLDAAGRRCALRLDAVAEILRPLPLQALAGLPAFVLGAALVRGRAAPVADLSQLLGGAPGRNARWVSLKLAAGPAMLSVDAVQGVFDLPAGSQTLAPLLDGASTPVQALRVLDAALLAVLEAARLVPDAAFAALRSTALDPA
jgi:purine-binding chemotaxis protein CheW